MMAALFSVIFVVLGTATVVYFVAPGIVYRTAMGLARRHGRLKSKQISVAGHDVAYLEGGSGPPLILLHGFGANKDHWTLIAPFLTRHYRLIVPDLPGFGDSSRRDSANYATAPQLERIGAFADALGVDTFHLGGNSMGGYLAAMFAARNSSRVQSLWLLAPAGAMSAAPSEVLEEIEAGHNPLVTETAEDFDRLTELCFTVAPPMPGQFKRPLLARAKREAAFNQKIFEELFADVEPLENAIAGLLTPSLVVWGDNDRILDCSGLAIVSGLLSDAKSILMPRMGHVPMLERPAETAASYLEFRKELA